MENVYLKGVLVSLNFVILVTEFKLKLKKRYVYLPLKIKKKI